MGPKTIVSNEISVMFIKNNMIVLCVHHETRFTPLFWKGLFK